MGTHIPLHICLWHCGSYGTSVVPGTSISAYFMWLWYNLCLVWNWQENCFGSVANFRGALFNRLFMSPHQLTASDMDILQQIVVLLHRHGSPLQKVNEVWKQVFNFCKSSAGKHTTQPGMHYYIVSWKCKTYNVPSRSSVASNTAGKLWSAIPSRLRRGEKQQCLAACMDLVTGSIQGVLKVNIYSALVCCQLLKCSCKKQQLH